MRVVFIVVVMAGVVDHVIVLVLVLVLVLGHVVLPVSLIARL